ncbi:hypothetical protein [Ferrigenium sp. UT5]|uniref:hypothetical protein n=1 Tax=Ferrigenium sp. UT5 TaxID=3242105 RepID=UPI0038B29042
MPVSTSSSTHQSAPGKSLDCIRTMQALIDHHEQLEHFLLGQTTEKPVLAEPCYPECMLAKYMHGEQNTDPSLHRLFESTCRQCETFHESAGRAVARKENGHYTSDGELLHAVQSLRATSERLQEHLVNWYLHHPVSA